MSTNSPAPTKLHNRSTISNGSSRSLITSAMHTPKFARPTAEGRARSFVRVLSSRVLLQFLEEVYLLLTSSQGAGLQTIPLQRSLQPPCKKPCNPPAKTPATPPQKPLQEKCLTLQTPMQRPLQYPCKDPCKHPANKL